MSEEITIEQKLENFLLDFNKRFDGRAKKQHLHDMIAHQLDMKVMKYVTEYFTNFDGLELVTLLRVLGEQIEKEQQEEMKRLEDIKMEDPVYRKNMKKLQKAVDRVKVVNNESKKKS